MSGETCGQGWIDCRLWFRDMFLMSRKMIDFERRCELIFVTRFSSLEKIFSVISESLSFWIFIFLWNKWNFRNKFVENWIFEIRLKSHFLELFKFLELPTPSTNPKSAPGDRRRENLGTKDKTIEFIFKSILMFLLWLRLGLGWRKYTEQRREEKTRGRVTFLIFQFHVVSSRSRDRPRRTIVF